MKLDYGAVPQFDVAIFGYTPLVTSRTAWTIVAVAALQSFDIVFATRIYRQIFGDAGMVMTLNRIAAVEELTELSAHLCVIFNDFQRAHDLFLASSNPKEALYLAIDIMDFPNALLLAAKYEPGWHSEVALDFATQLEMDGKISESHTMFEEALSTFKDFKQSNTSGTRAQHLTRCQSGYTRATLRSGDIPLGMKLLQKMESDPQLFLDCARILEELKQYNEAAQIYERAEKWESAAEIWIKCKFV